MAGVEVMISDMDFPEVREVDLKLIELARTLQGKIVTNDFNLNKVAQLRGVDVRVALRGAQPGVAEELLNRSQIGAALEKVRRERVPEGVARHPLRHTRSAPAIRDGALHRRPA